MSLLLIPILLGAGSIWGTAWVTNRQTDAQNALSEQIQKSDKQQHDDDLNIAQENRWDDLFRTYRDGIDTLLLNHELRRAHPGDEASEIAHSRTIDVLESIDPKHRKLVIEYLSILKLIQSEIFDYQQRKWHQQEINISLIGVNLEGVHLIGTNLRGVHLIGANLRKVRFGIDGQRFTGPTLHKADLSASDLSGAYLYGVDLTDAYLSGANLTGADLTDALQLHLFL